ncbi:Zinc ribbon domain protein [compost metagenome]
MPIYEYRCAECGHQKEFLQRMSDAPLKDCPECGKPAFNKLLSAAGFQLKGTGWYATDFKNNNAKPAAKAEKSTDNAKPADHAKPSDGAKPADSATTAASSTQETPKTGVSSTTSATPAS